MLLLLATFFYHASTARADAVMHSIPGQTYIYRMPNAAASALPSADADVDFDTFVREQKERQAKILGAIQPLQSLSNPRGPASAYTDWLGKMTQKFSPAMIGALEDIKNNPKKSEVIYVEIGFFIIVLLLRSWRRSKTRSWLAQIWVSLWSTFLLWSGLFFFIPWLIFGYSYYVLLSGFLGLVLGTPSE